MSEASDGVEKNEIWTVSYGSTPYIALFVNTDLVFP